MKHSSILALITILFFVLASCEGEWEMQHIVVNETNKDVLVTWKEFQEDNSSSLILTANAESSLLNEFDYGVIKSQMESRSEPPFHSVLIETIDGEEFLRDATAFSEWEQQIDKGNNKGQFRLVIVDADF